MKRLLGILLILIQFQALANMANPETEGTLGGRPFVSQYAEVIHEDLFIRIDEDFKHAFFNVTYHINSSKDGFQIPFLFYASEYLDSFSVKIDGREVAIMDIPGNLKVPENTKFKDFAYFFEKSSYDDRSSVLLEDSPSGGFNISLENMIYFEADIPEGAHRIEVSYRATKWIDSWGWVNQYSFRYALSPAKYWKSFGTLSVTVDASSFNVPLNSNLGEPSSGDLGSVANWEFDELPTEILQINYDPIIDEDAQKLMDIGPEKLALACFIAMAILHLIVLIWYRKKKPSKRFSPVVIIGSILIPLFFLMIWMNLYDVIDFLIGEHAGRSHGYTFFLVVLYPIILPLYWLVYWLIDKLIKKKFTRQQSA